MLSSEDSINLLLAFAGVQSIEIEPSVAEWNTLSSTVTGFAGHKTGTRPYLRFISKEGTSQVYPRTTTTNEEFPKAVPHNAHFHGCCVSKNGDVLTFYKRTLPNHVFGTHTNPCSESDSNWLMQFSLALRSSETKAPTS